MEHRKNYSYDVHGSVIVIQDEDRSVLNNVVRVLGDLAKAGFDLPAYRLVCRENGIWGEIMVTDGRYAGFRSLNERDLSAALAKVTTK